MMEEESAIVEMMRDVQLIYQWKIVKLSFVAVKGSSHDSIVGDATMDSIGRVLELCNR